MFKKFTRADWIYFGGLLVLFGIGLYLAWYVRQPLFDVEHTEVHEIEPGQGIHELAPGQEGADI